ncbi:LOW QUALITY PROTEIN: F-box protein [Cinnamomum micranthum f. kanehirae]|uniref:F-box protein n=1 Tax=Cinnamomum micranthum f. kanehirae TaxID=337451 RepID=A0A3S3ND58_9MAGN|nr:LOW QUALITY PROTEIN: F-box protein [Cinnamomum micranthum f. kanehirae]
MDEEGWSSCDATDLCGSRLLHSLSDDVLSIISTFLFPRDLCNLSLCCRSLAFSDKLWLVQCSITNLLHPRDLLKWRSSLSSYRVLCRFLLSARPLLSSSSRSASSPSSPAASPLSAAPPASTPGPSCGPQSSRSPPGPTDPCNSSSAGGSDLLHPGLVNSIDPNCNILFLEVEPCLFVSASAPAVPFNGLDLEDEQMLLELVADQVPDSLNSCFPLFFPHSMEEEAGGGGLGLLEEGRSYLINMYNNLRGIAKRILEPPDEFCFKLQSELRCHRRRLHHHHHRDQEENGFAYLYRWNKTAFGKSNCRNEASIFSTSCTRERERRGSRLLGGRGRFFWLPPRGGHLKMSLSLP